jgi:hypothetical protein
MTAFLPDTNVWITARGDAGLTSKFEKALAAGDKFLIAPPALIELVRGTVRQGNKRFSEDKKTYIWMREHKCEVLELPKPFMAKILGTTLRQTSNVTPRHYEQLIEMLVSSTSFDEFVQRCNTKGSVWTNIESLDRIHEEQIDHELGWLKKLAAQSVDIASGYSKLFGLPGSQPDPLIIKREFSAFIEYLEGAFQRAVSKNANLQKNDRGMYVDFQLLTYLAMPELVFLTNDAFSNTITKSPQKNRILEPEIAMTKYYVQMTGVKPLILSLTLFVLGLGAFFAYRAIAKHRDLQETLSWMDQTYNPHEGGDNFGRGHGWEIHRLRTDNHDKVTEKYKETFTHDGSCKVVFHTETLPEGAFVETPSVSTYTFSLCDIDPDSIKIKTYDLRDTLSDCTDPEAVKAYKLSCDFAEVFFLTRNGATAINEETITTYTNLTGADHESRTSSKTNKYWLIVDDVPYAQRLAKALKHAVELCGGKTSRF